MWTLLLSLASAADPEAIAQVDYLHESRPNGMEARQAALALVEADPQDLGAQTTWIRVSTPFNDRSRKMVVPTYRAWVAEDPQDPVRRAALAYAIGVAGGSYPEEFPVAGPWCDESLAAFGASVPVAVGDRAGVLSVKRRILTACDRDHQAEDAELLALSEVTPRAYGAAIAIVLADHAVDEAEAALVKRVVADEPWRVEALARLWRKELAGAGVEPARASAVEVAVPLAASDDAMRVDASIAVLRAAKHPGLEAAILRLTELDPGRQRAVQSADRAPPKPPLAPAHIGGDAAMRLAAHDARRADQPDWLRGGWHATRAELLTDLGRDREALDERRLAARWSWDYDENITFARATVAQDRWLRRGLRAADDAVNVYGRPSDDNDASAARDVLQELLAEAYRARASSYRALGRDGKAEADAYASLLLKNDPEGHALMGLLTEPTAPGIAFEHLTLALATGSGDAALDAEARAALDRLWGLYGGWVPGGIDGWLALHAGDADADAAVADEETVDPRVGQPFPDLPITVDGVATTLSAYPGPIVVDLWATWCAPCIAALPGIDTVARRHPKVPLLAVSVDDELATPTAYLAESDTAFVQAWGGYDTLKMVGLKGVPVTFVLDAEHRIVLVIEGYSGSDTELDEAMTALE